jgi:hypothetical protein
MRYSAWFERWKIVLVMFGIAFWFAFATTADRALAQKVGRSECPGTEVKRECIMNKLKQIFASFHP